MARDVLEQPILVIGAARSGTQLLARVLAAHPDLAYIDEPTLTWRRGNGHLPHEMFPVSAARPEVVRSIRERFREMCEAQGGSRILEKSPANTLRLGFVRQVFPDARLLHLVRDGRDVAVSVRRKFEGNADKVTRAEVPAPARGGPWVETKRAIAQAVRKMRSDPPGLDLVYRAPDLFELLLARAGLRRHAIWGPRIPGFRQLMRTHTPLEVAALQWRTCVEQVLNYTASHPEAPCLFVRFEDLCNAPRQTAEKVYAFCDLEPGPELEPVLSRILPVEPRAFERHLTPDEIAQVETLVGDTLRRLGYEV